MVEEHANCRCQCKTKATDCNAHQVYEPRSCRCDCRDKATQASCVGPQRRWDTDRCQCLCAFEKPCSTGLYFSHNTCRCERYPYNLPNSYVPPSVRHAASDDNTEQTP